MKNASWGGEKEIENLQKITSCAGKKGKVDKEENKCTRVCRSRKKIQNNPRLILNTDLSRNTQLKEE